MSKVLFIKANNRPAEQAVSVKLYEEFLNAYRTSHPEDEITELDLFAAELPYYDHSILTALYKEANGLELTAEEAKLAALVGGYFTQFADSDKVVFGFPLWNMTVPAVLHTYMDYLAQAGKSFKYTENGPVGLLTGKKAVLLNARGGVYSEGPAAAAEMAVNYVRGNLKLFGFTDIHEIIIEGHNQMPQQAAEIIGKGLENAREAALTF
ncbi:FMN-dependent NADH-azoreductase [Paenibacillus spiritus]|uniref:FMN dependent NADH:quinone oxidoreductase n=1 Tax=Paenibacillus spiritus TaxID=2496557 RepID=A0A5J5GFE9_9BACL|nr:FMN-dependent NADH-azoreductase [Paenibacillus spiritus]KAA9006482.1 FMN-dependent NADH-azoreductase [Paenibacillus spiritus]